MKAFFWRSYLCGRKLHKNLSGKFGKLRANILRTLKNLPAPTPMNSDTSEEK